MQATAVDTDAGHWHITENITIIYIMYVDTYVKRFVRCKTIIIEFAIFNEAF